MTAGSPSDGKEYDRARTGQSSENRSRRRRIYRVLGAALLCLLVLFAARAALWRPLALTGPSPSDGFTRIRGVIHVHTTLSDGGGTPEEVIQAAQAEGLDFLVITDHNHLNAKPFEGYHGSLLVLVGVEISTITGYVLGLGIPDPAYRFSGSATDAFNDIRDLGGLAFASHPTSPREEFSWRGWDMPGDWGLEVFNLDCQWRAANKARLLRAAALYSVNSRYALLGMMKRPDYVLGNWDALLEKRHVPAIAASDAHSRIKLTAKKALRLPSYETLFAIAQNHVMLERRLTGDAASDGAAVLAAIAMGRNYIGLDALVLVDGFYYEAVVDERRWAMGETVPAALRPRLRAGGRLPQGARLVLLRNGHQLAESVADLEVQTSAPGAYRIEVYAPGWPTPCWILSNPIYIFDPTETAARIRRARPPAEPALPSATRILDDFEGGTVFRPEFDRSSFMSSDMLDAASPWRGGSAGRMSFRLGDGDAGRYNASCALVSRAKRDLKGASGLVFALRGDDNYRIHVQLRDENPAARDDGAETWFASAKTSRDWRRVAIPFSVFRSTDPNTDGRLDLDRVRLLAFVIDKGADKVGVGGTIWFDDVGIY
jgi:hypothetical protein